MWLTLPPYQPHNATEWLRALSRLLEAVSVVAVLGAVLIDFLDVHGRAKPKRQRRSIVDTGTMLAFVMMIYILIRFNIGSVTVSNGVLTNVLTLLGACIVAIGAVVNIRGRIDLGKNWANQVVIYTDHTLVTSGVYRFVRHPLYASIIWMLFGASIMEMNIGSTLATAAIFIPFMTYRAKQEEAALLPEFPAYAAYTKRVPRFFPSLHHHDAI